MHDNYSGLEKFLHRMALGTMAVRELTFDIEKGRFRKKAGPAPTRNIFVCGLARAGTTALLNGLYASNSFAALTYSDMPFVLAPNGWLGLSGRFGKAMERQERAHGDGIMVGTDSPESLDEIFWAMFDQDRFSGQGTVQPYTPSDEALAAYPDFMALVCLRYGRDRYLCKNNNNIFRLQALAPALPDSRFLVPVRDPAGHVASLMQQHARFADSTPFQRQYMRWLGHFEFGATHLPHRFPDMPDGPDDPAAPGYWLRIWIGAHRHLLSQATRFGNVLPVSYADMSVERPAFVSQVGAACDVALDPAAFRPRVRAVDLDLPTDLQTMAEEVHGQLVDLSRTRFGTG